MTTDLLLAVPVPSLIRRDPPLIPDLGLSYLATAVRQAGFTVQAIDWNPRISEQEYRARVAAAQPRVVGLKVFTVNFAQAYAALRLMRSVAPDAIRLLGGPHPTTAPPEYLFHEFPDADLAVAGEAETALPMLMELLSSIDFSRDRLGELRDRFPRVPGLIWREGGAVLHNPTVFEDISRVPTPAWDLFRPESSCHFPIDPEVDLTNPHVAPLLTTRGCPFRCTFCSAYHVNSRSARRRPAADLLEEIRYLHDNHAIRQFVVTDSAFLLDRPWVMELCEGILQSGMDIRWECLYEVQENLDSGSARGFLETMYRAGCRKIGFSPETISPRMIKAIRKNFDPDELRELVRLAHGMGMTTMGFFMVGFPGETEADVDATLRFALEEPFHVRFFTMLVPLPGTEIYEGLRARHGFKRIQWDNYQFHDPPFQISEVPVRVLSQKLYLANMKAQFKTPAGWRGVRPRMLLGMGARYAYRRWFSR